MANKHKAYVGRRVSYLDNTRPAGNPRLRWTAAVITTVISPTVVRLRYSRTNVAINGGANVNKATRVAGETNVWRPY